jgi:hypothetical protein
MDPALLDKLGPNTAAGAVWLHDSVHAGIPSEPFLFSGWPLRSCWLSHKTRDTVRYTFEVDKMGDNKWESLKSITLSPESSSLIPFTSDESGEWIRVRAHRNTLATAHFTYGDRDDRDLQSPAMFEGVSLAGQEESLGGLLYGLGNNQRRLGMAASLFKNSDERDFGYYELNEKLELTGVHDPETKEFIRERFAIPEQVITLDSSSVLVVDDGGRRWRLPLGDTSFTKWTDAGSLRISREVATERDLFSCHGTFYELPAENADGFAKIRPIASHSFRIHDYASYRGLLVMTGIDPDHAGDNPHIVTSSDGKAAVWVGVVDDLWKLGKPRGLGGPWYRSEVEKGEVSDPYLIGFYDKKSLEIFHESDLPRTFQIEVEPVGHGPWMKYLRVTVNPDEVFRHRFPEHFQSRWIRFRSESQTTVTTWLTYL